MKAAILGTSDYHPTMQQVAKHALQRLGGYIPPTVEHEELDLHLPPVRGDFGSFACYIAQSLASCDAVPHCNPRSPYLFIAWMLVGSDNPFRMTRHIKYDGFHRRVACQYLRIALGEIPEAEVFQRTLGYDLRNARFMAERAADIVAEFFDFYLPRPEMRVQSKAREVRSFLMTCIAYYVRVYPELYSHFFAVKHLESRSYDAIERMIAGELTQRLQCWMSRTDDELLPIIHRLFLDILQIPWR